MAAPAVAVVAGLQPATSAWSPAEDRRLRFVVALPERRSAAAEALQIGLVALAADAVGREEGDGDQMQHDEHRRVDQARAVGRSRPRPAPGCAPCGKPIALSNRVDAKMPMPDIDFCTKLLAAKNVPSARRPVVTSLSSTMSATIDAMRMLDMMMIVTMIVLNTAKVGSRRGDPLAGKRSRSRKTTGNGPSATAVSDATERRRLLPMAARQRAAPRRPRGRRTRSRAAPAPTSASERSSQKNVLK